jgi:hypothetical protein
LVRDQAALGIDDETGGLARLVPFGSNARA